MRTHALLLTSFATIVLLTATGSSQQMVPRGEWRWHSGDSGSTKYSPLDQIRSDNVSRLHIAWRRPAVDRTLVSKIPNFSFSNNFRATPLMIDNVLYSPNGKEKRGQIL